MLLIASTAIAQDERIYTQVPDLLDLVETPLRAEYRLTCKNIQGESEAQGYTAIRAKDGLVRMSRFLSVELVLMRKMLRPSDFIAKALLVSVCLEQRTDYVPINHRAAGRQPARDLDPNKVFDEPHLLEWVQQVSKAR